MTDYLQYTPNYLWKRTNRNKQLKLSKKKRNGQPFYPDFFQDYNSRTHELMDFCKHNPNHFMAHAVKLPNFPKGRLSARIWEVHGATVISNIREFTPPNRNTPYSNKFLELEFFASEHHGCGLGKFGMAEICELLDTHNIPMILSPNPLDSYTKKNKLVAFYRKFGFKAFPVYSTSMLRKPKPWS